MVGEGVELPRPSWGGDVGGEEGVERIKREREERGERAKEKE